jgi:hypothetical protein
VLILIFNQVPILVPGDSAIGVDLLGIVADLQLAESALGIDALRCELPLADAAAGAESAAVGQVPGDAAVGSDIAAIDLAFAEAAVGSMLAAVMSGIDLADAAVGVDAIDVPEAAGVPQPTPVAATFLFGSHELSYGGRAAEHNPSRDTARGAEVISILAALGARDSAQASARLAVRKEDPDLELVALLLAA